MKMEMKSILLVGMTASAMMVALGVPSSAPCDTAGALAPPEVHASAHNSAAKHKKKLRHVRTQKTGSASAKKAATRPNTSNVNMVASRIRGLRQVFPGGSAAWKNDLSVPLSPAEAAARKERTSQVLAKKSELKRLLAAGAYAQVVEGIASASKRFPREAEALLPTELAEAYLRLNMDDDALATLKLCGINERLVSKQGLVLARLGRLEESRSLDPFSLVSRHFVWTAAEAKATLPSPANRRGLVTLWLLAASCGASGNGDVFESAYYAREALKLDPSQAVAKWILSDALFSEHKYVECSRLLAEAAQATTGNFRRACLECRDRSLERLREQQAQQKAAATNK